MSKKVMINCNEATSICNKSQYCESSFLNKLRLSFHILLCKKCKLYSKQNRFITKLFKTHLHKITKEVKLCYKDKEQLKKNLDKEINK